MSPRPLALVTVILAPALLALALGTVARAGPAKQQQRATQRVQFRVPAETEMHDSAYRASAVRGKAILLATRDSVPRSVGNSLRCASCHLGNGLRKDAMPWVGSYARFPQYRARSGKVDLIEDRVNDCFERSMNGRALDPRGRDMRDIVAYFAFLSTGIPVGAEVDGQGLRRLSARRGDLARGSEIFKSTCSRCHGASGEGSVVAPPLWGGQSYNIGAGMANITTAASFVYALMPIDRARQLTEQQAFDVATFINTRPRPDFPRRSRDWPHGGKPPGADYHVLPLPNTASKAAAVSSQRTNHRGR